MSTINAAIETMDNAIAEIEGLRARVAKLEAVLLENYDQINALRAYVAKLEAGGEPNSYEARMDAYGKKIDELMARNAKLREALIAVDVMRGKLFISGAGVIASIDVWKVYRDAALKDASQ